VSPVTVEQQRADLFTVEIIKDALTAVSDEMFATMQSTAKSPIIYEVLDFACGLTDRDGQLITQGNGLTGFLGTLTYAVKTVVEGVAADDLAPGDVFLMNDPYGGGGTHQNDVVLVKPLFRGDDVLAYAACKAHWSDIGGMTPGSMSTTATEGYQEGLLLPCVRVYRRGEPVQDLLDVVARNVRFPEIAFGDMDAQRACLEIAQQRFGEICERYGDDVVLQAMEALLDHGEQLTRDELAKLPKGVYEAEDTIDDDGLGNGPFRVVVRVTITEDSLTCDFTGTAAEAPGPINLPRVGLIAAARMVFKAVTGPEIEANDGCFRPLRVVCPPGTIVTASRPAPTSLFYETQVHAAEVIWKALAAAMPDRLTAGHFLSPSIIILAGTHPAKGDAPYLLGEMQAGGWGAGADKDGESALVCVGNGESFVWSVEVTEAHYGVRIESYALDPAAAGAGRHRGGLGVTKEYVLLSDAELTSTVGRHDSRPWGVDGGREGSSNLVRVQHADGRVVELGKTQRYALKAGERISVVTGHGAGWGPPEERSADQIFEDVRDGYVTAAQAARDYGVVVDGEAATPESRQPRPMEPE
jgi:N-methylhydantoinase B